MKHYLALCSLPLMFLTLAPIVKADSYKTIEGISYALSPDSHYVVGMAATQGDDSFSSFIYDRQTDKIDWRTNYNPSDLSKSGRFIAVNNSGVIAGTVKNPNLRLPVEEGDFRPSSRAGEDAPVGPAICSAAVWRDGKNYILGSGARSIEAGDFVYEEDGTQAIGISPDGNIVYGQVWSGYMPVMGCYWTYDEKSDSYEYAEIPLPQGATIGYPEKVSDNGVMVGRVGFRVDDDNMMFPVVWTSPDKPMVIAIPDPGINDSAARAISADGKLVAVVGGGSLPYLGIYNVETMKLTPVQIPDRIYRADATAIDNKGNMACILSDYDKWADTRYYYDNTYQTMTVFSFYLDDVSKSYPSTFNDVTSSVTAISGDGKTILAAPGVGSYDSWIISIDDPQIMAANPPTEVKIFHASPDRVGVSWNGIDHLADDLKLIGYDVYVNNDYAETVDATEVGGKFTVYAEAEAGRNNTAYVVTLYEKKGVETSSAQSVVATTFVSRNTNLIDYVDFDDSAMDGNGNIIWERDTWNASVNYGNRGELINWHLTANDFENRTPFAAVYTVSTTPWSSLFTSHFMDAANHKDFRLHFRYKLQLINTLDQDLSTDFLNVEGSDDGENWKVLKSIKGSDIKAGVWKNVEIDLGKEWSGKMFQLRFNAKGEGQGQLSWQVDNINITDKNEGDTPTGLIATSATDKAVEIAWHNTLDTHEVSYLCNSGYVWDACIGNEGKPLIVAIDVPKDKLEYYDGQYISSLTTFLYDDPSIEVQTPTRAEAIIYEDRNEVARTDFFYEFTDANQATAWFDHPVKIDSEKQYLAAVRVYDTHVQQTPVYYQIDSSAMTGKTDIYSDNDGRTWKTAQSSIVTDTNPEGNCIWPIRVNITPEPRTEMDLHPDTDLIYYEVFRNGEAISENVYEPHPAFVDNEPLMNATYQVRAFYRDGSVSPLSEALVVDASGIRDAAVSTLNVIVDNASRMVTINGDVQSVQLIDMNGMVLSTTTSNQISTSALSAGSYILNCRTSAGSEVYRIIVR